MYVVHTVRGSGPSRNFDLSIPFPSFRLAFFLWSTPSRNRVCLPPDPNLLLRLYHQHKNERGKIKIGSAMQRRAIYYMLLGRPFSIGKQGRGETKGIEPVPTPLLHHDRRGDEAAKERQEKRETKNP